MRYCLPICVKVIWAKGLDDSQLNSKTIEQLKGLSYKKY